jgi:hypothetical protein
MLVTIVRSPLALNVGGEEPSVAGSSGSQSQRTSHPIAAARLGPDAGGAAGGDVGAVGGDVVDDVLGG